MLRQPIIAVLGHVDHGKTTLLDTIRKTAITSKEAGGITQSISTTEIPADTIKDICGPLLNVFKFDLTIPGLLFIDTPGHEAFTSLRKRGGSIADLVILVVDINEGIMPQTLESIEILKQTKTPFVVAVNKIDRIHGWLSDKESFMENVKEQKSETIAIFEESFYKTISQFSDHDFSVERFDRVEDFTKTIAAVPISGKTGEGIPELLAILVGLSQKFLKSQLIKTDKSEGIILEVRNYTGMGTTIDCIIYDGIVHKNDFLVIENPPMITKIRALLVPEHLRDMRMEKKFKSVEKVSAATAVKISSPGLDNIMTGFQIRTTKSFDEAEKLLEEMEKEKECIEFEMKKEGIILKADTRGSLEALMNIFKDCCIKSACTGMITKKDIITAEANKINLRKVIIGFNVSVCEDAQKLAKDKNVKIFDSDVIYKLIENYKKWVDDETAKTTKKELELITRAGKLKIIPGCIFRASNPAIVGCEVSGGIVKPGYKLFKEGKGEIGEVKQIQSQGQNVAEAKIGDKIAVSIIGPTVGRQIIESDTLYTDISSNDYKKLMKNKNLLTEHEKSVLEEIKEIKRRKNPRWGF